VDVGSKLLGAAAAITSTGDDAIDLGLGSVAVGVVEMAVSPLAYPDARAILRLIRLVKTHIHPQSAPRRTPHGERAGTPASPRGSLMTPLGAYGLQKLPQAGYSRILGQCRLHIEGG